MFKNYELILGVFLFIFSLVITILFIKSYSFLGAISLGVNWVSIFFIIDFFDRKLLKDSYISRKGSRRIIKLAVISLCFGLVLDIFGVVFTKFWTYPFFPLNIYIYLLPLGYLIYTLMLLGIYEIMKNLTGGKTKYSKTPALYSLVMHVILVIGMEMILLVVFSTIGILSSQHVAFLDITKAEKVTIPFWYPFEVQLGLFLIFEFICYKEKKSTLTKDILNGNFHPILAILLANVVAVILIEFINAPFGVWKFGNWPFNNLQILTVPVFALLAWPIQFPALLAMIRAALSKEEIDIW